MRKTKVMLFKMIFSFVLLSIFFVGLATVTGYGINYLKDVGYKKRITNAINLNKVVSTNMQVNEETLNALESNNKEKVDEFDAILDKKISEATTFDVLDEEILEIELYDIRNDSLKLVYSYKYKDLNSQVTANVLNENLQNNETSKLLDDRFISMHIVENELGEKLSCNVVYTSREKYDILLNSCNLAIKIFSVIYFILFVMLYVNVVFKVKFANNKDSLTGLLGKSVYKKEIGKLIYKHPYEKGVLYIIGFRDLHDFEEPNMELIEDIVYIFSGTLKKYKTKKSVLARISERKLGLYIHDIKNSEEVLEKLLKDVEKLLRSKREYQNIQYYMGVAFYPEHEKTVDALVNGAIYALETLKSGKKQYHIKNYQIYDPTSRREYVDKQYLYDEVEKIVNERRVYSVFQAIVDLKDGKVMGYEALSRPISELVPNIGMLISLASEMKIMSDLELMLIYIINETVFEAKESFADKYLFINTNVSVKYGDKELAKFKNTIDKISQKLVVELTEYDEIDFETITTKIDKVKSFGAKIAIDDFGSGYSNELALLSLKPDIVKIDMALIRNIDKDQRKYQIVENLTSYAKNNDIKVLAEGVETSKELEVVKGLGIDYVQGYIFAKPERNAIDRVFDIDEYIRKDVK